MKMQVPEMEDVEVLYNNRYVKAQKKTGRMTEACLSNFAKTEGETKHGPLMILGYPFFRQYYVRFSWKQNEDRPAVFIDHPQHHCGAKRTETSSTSSDSSDESLASSLLQENDEGTNRRVPLVL